MIIKHNFFIPQLNTKRNIRVYLPPSYERGNRFYSVVYMHDGQNIFDSPDAFARPWYVDKLVDKMPIYKQTIVVGIDNSGSSRIDEYAPFKNKNQGGKGEKYMRFIVETLKPFIDKEYRSLSSSEHTWLIGSSLGGLITYYGGLLYPNIFGKIGVLSPAFWFNPKIMEYNPVLPLDNNRFYVVGSKAESASMEQTLQQTYWRLKALNVPDERLTVIARDIGGHNEAFWNREFKKMYEVFYGVQPSIIKKNEIKTKGI
jgi:predicted alpha/beta superfamily hydrolase